MLIAGANRAYLSTSYNEAYSLSTSYSRNIGRENDYELNPVTKYVRGGYFVLGEKWEDSPVKIWSVSNVVDIEIIATPQLWVVDHDGLPPSVFNRI